MLDKLRRGVDGRGHSKRLFRVSMWRGIEMSSGSARRDFAAYVYKKKTARTFSCPCREASDANYFRLGDALHNRNKYTIA